MAVAMEVASWRGPSELGGSPVRKKRAWGADTQQLMQLMMGQLHHPQPELTLDLLGKSDPTSAAATTPSSPQFSPEFLHLDPEDSSQPLPSGWEKCLDLQTGKLYYVNKSSGVRSSNDPRKEMSRRDFYSPQAVEIELRTAAKQQEEEVEAPLAHEFLGSKKSETESLKFAGCSSSSSESPARIAPTTTSTRVPPSSSSRKKKLWSPHVTGASCCSSRGREEDSRLELDLNLAAGGSASSPRLLQTVCTMEMIQNALRRTNETAVKREVMVKRLRLKSSVSSSFSSLTNSTALSEGSGGSPSTSSSSSASSRSGAGLQAPSTGVCEAESTKVESAVEPGALVMGACTRCLMYVMLNKADPRCPRCDSKVPVDFAPSCRRQRGGLKLGLKHTGSR